MTSFSPRKRSCDFKIRSVLWALSFLGEAALFIARTVGGCARSWGGRFQKRVVHPGADKPKRTPNHRKEREPSAVKPFHRKRFRCDVKRCAIGKDSGFCKFVKRLDSDLNRKKKQVDGSMFWKSCGKYLKLTDLSRWKHRRWNMKKYC